MTEAETPGHPRLGLPRGPARSEGCDERQWKRPVVVRS